MHLIDFVSIAEFSRDRCIAICAFLIPANLFATISTLAIVFFNYSSYYLRWTVAIATGLALLMVFHVGTWFAIGVVTPVTYILLSLATTCLVVNFGVLIFLREQEKRKSVTEFGERMKAYWFALGYRK